MNSYYYRYVTRRMPTPPYGKIRYLETIEIVFTNDITPYNYRKHLKFSEIALKDLIKLVKPTEVPTKENVLKSIIID